jgi:thioredoxin reductase
MADRPVGPGQARFSPDRQRYPTTRLDNENLTPLFLETSRPGIFAIGDVRSGSVKRVAAAIGEGSVAVRLAFERLQSAGMANPTVLPAR